jgi:ribosomal 50S subunit-recycling heat shock protein
VLTITLHGSVRVVRVLGEAERRGSASAARQLYDEIGLEKNEGASTNALC